MSKGLRTAAFPADVARARPTQPGLPVEIRPPWGAYLVERAPDGLRLTVEAARRLTRLFIDAARDGRRDELGELVATRTGIPRRRYAPGSEARQSRARRRGQRQDQLLAAWLGERHALFPWRGSRATCSERSTSAASTPVTCAPSCAVSVRSAGTSIPCRSPSPTPASPRWPTRWRNASSLACVWRRCVRPGGARGPSTAYGAARSPASGRSGSSRAPGSRPRPRPPRWSWRVRARARRRAH